MASSSFHTWSSSQSVGTAKHKRFGATEHGDLQRLLARNWEDDKDITNGMKFPWPCLVANPGRLIPSVMGPRRVTKVTLDSITNDLLTMICMKDDGVVRLHMSRRTTQHGPHVTAWEQMRFGATDHVNWEGSNDI